MSSNNDDHAYKKPLMDADFDALGGEPDIPNPDNMSRKDMINELIFIEQDIIAQRIDEIKTLCELIEPSLRAKYETYSNLELKELLFPMIH